LGETDRVVEPPEETPGAAQTTNSAATARSVARQMRNILSHMRGALGFDELCQHGELGSSLGVKVIAVGR